MGGCVCLNYSASDSHRQGYTPVPVVHVTRGVAVGGVAVRGVAVGGVVVTLMIHFTPVHSGDLLHCVW